VGFMVAKNYAKSSLSPATLLYAADSLPESNDLYHH